MGNGFNVDKTQENLPTEELNKLVKKYKKMSKYRKSSLFAVKTMDDMEEMVGKLVDGLKNKPIE